jgi:hypothetical protein
VGRVFFSELGLGSIDRGETEMAQMVTLATGLVPLFSACYCDSPSVQFCLKRDLLTVRTYILLFLQGNEIYYHYFQIR